MQGPQVLLALQESIPAVTGTASFAQGAATWAASASEKFTSTATWSQDASWSATAVEKFTSTAAWSQTASWDASISERFTSTAAFVQAAATWDATASESIPSTATWSQDASWAALGQSAEDVTAEGEWVQDAASWMAASGQLNTATATWLQDAAQWEAAGESVEPVAEPVDAAGEWTQTATWAGLASQAGVTVTPPVVGGMPRLRRPPTQLNIPGRASFGQGPGDWAAFIEVDASPVEVEELLLAGVL